MGGHGGLNILPQKRWNVYNFDNREKVRKDEETAAKDEQIQREQSRKHDSSIRIQQLRHLRGLAPPPQPPVAAVNSSIAAGNDSTAAVTSFPAKNAVKSVEKAARSSIGDETLISAKSDLNEAESDAIPAELSYLLSESKSELKSESKHMNLFAGIKIFDPKSVDEKKRKRREEDENDRRKKTKKKVEEVRVIGPEDEVYRLGFGVAGKGVAKPWYALKKRVEEDEDEEEDGRVGVEKKKTGKKTVLELREERLRREAGEKERERVLLLRNGGGSVRRGSGSGSGSGSGRDIRDRERRQWR